MCPTDPRGERIPERPDQGRSQLFPLGPDADPELPQRRAVVLRVEDAELAAEGALVEHQARHDPDAATQADQGEDRLAARHLAVDARDDAPAPEPAVGA